MNCLIVDDEPQARKLLTTYISDIPGCKVICACRTALEAYEVLQTGKVDLLFLDDKTPVISSTDFLRSLKNPPLVILTTTQDQFAPEGHTLNAVDYLQKPIVQPRLMQAIEKAWARYKENLFIAATPPAEFTFVKQEGNLVKVAFKDIRFVEGLQNTIKIHLTDSIMIVSSTLKAFEKILPPDQFIRVHHTYIASVGFIAAMRKNQAAMPGIELPAGLVYKGELLKSLGNDPS